MTGQWLRMRNFDDHTPSYDDRCEGAMTALLSPLSFLTSILVLTIYAPCCWNVVER